MQMGFLIFLGIDIFNKLIKLVNVDSMEIPFFL
jgi:hypothetical protein